MALFPKTSDLLSDVPNHPFSLLQLLVLHLQLFFFISPDLIRLAIVVPDSAFDMLH
jgi:hypothetical protein